MKVLYAESGGSEGHRKKKKGILIVSCRHSIDYTHTQTTGTRSAAIHVGSLSFSSCESWVDGSFCRLVGLNWPYFNCLSLSLARSQFKRTTFKDWFGYVAGHGHRLERSKKEQLVLFYNRQDRLLTVCPGVETRRTTCPTRILTVKDISPHPPFSLFYYRQPK